MPLTFQVKIRQTEVAIRNNTRALYLNICSLSIVLYGGIFRTYICLILKIRFRANGIRSRENGLTIRANEIRSRENGLIFHANGIRSRENGLTIRAN